MKKRILVIILIFLIMSLIGVVSIKLFYDNGNNNEFGEEWIEDKMYDSHRFDISEKHEYSNLEFNNAIFRLFDTGGYTFIVDVINNGNELIYHSIAEIEFLDKDNNVIFKHFIPIESLEPSKNKQSFTTYGDSTEEMKSVVDYRIYGLKQMD